LQQQRRRRLFVLKAEVTECSGRFIIERRIDKPEALSYERQRPALENKPHDDDELSRTPVKL